MHSILGVLNQEEMSVAEAFSFAYKVLFMINSDPRALIGGIVVILDATGTTSKNVISDPNTIRAMIRFVQVDYKHYHFPLKFVDWIYLKI